jgi:5-(carboxyamino)imidazole ribonucleotide synthase
MHELDVVELAIDRPIRIGIIGGGQLGKMIAQEAKRMSLKVFILDPCDECPAASVCDGLVVADYKAENAIRKLANMCDIITFEIELANSSTLRDLNSKKYPVIPSPEVLRIIQNKYLQKCFLKENNIDVPKFDLVRSETHLEDLSAEYGFPLMLKACQDSYDGKGNFLISSRTEINHAFNYFEKKDRMIEEFVPFTKEISVMVARNSDGRIEAFPVVENIHKKNILEMTIAPARITRGAESKAKAVAKETVERLGGVGIFGIEMFLVGDEKIVINELAPRPHNSGHYSIEACSISQFEQHIRAILNFPLAEPNLLCPAVMINVLGPEGVAGFYSIKGLKGLFSIPGLKLHVYGKKISKPNRKLGHVTILAETVEDAIMRAEIAKRTLKVEVQKLGKE